MRINIKNNKKEDVNISKNDILTFQNNYDSYDYYWIIGTAGRQGVLLLDILTGYIMEEFSNIKEAKTELNKTRDGWTLIKAEPSDTFEMRRLANEQI